MNPQILARSEFMEAVAEWDLTRPLGLDLETNGKKPFELAGRIVSFSLAGYTLDGTVTGFQVPLAFSQGTNADLDLLPEALVILQNARIIPFYIPMEASWTLSKWGVRLTFVGDGYILGRMLQMKDVGLKDLAEKVMNRKMIHLHEVLGPGKFDFSAADPQAEIVINYQIADAVNGLQLESLLSGKIRSRGMGAVYELEVQTATRLSQAALAGYQVDLQILDQELKQEEAAVVRLQSEIFTELGCEPFTLNSPAQLGAHLKAKGLNSPLKTDKGAESWSADALQILSVRLTSAGGPDNLALRDTLQKIKDWKSRFAVSNTLRKRPTDVSPDGCMHPVWNTIGYDGTSRIYSEGPSLTSLPAAARRALPAPPGKIWVKFDYKQFEVRILAFLSGDLALKALFKSGQDYHRSVFSRMSGRPYEEVTEKEREQSKIITYSVLYSGGNAYHVAQELGISHSEAAEKVSAYFRLFPVLHNFLTATRSHSQTTRHVRTYMGRLRRLEGDLQHMGDQACNAMGQQSGGTLLKLALNVLMSHSELGMPQLKGFCQPIPVFDALFYCIDVDVPMDAHIEFVRQVVELQLDDVKLETDFAVGPTWGSVEKTKLGLAQYTADFSSGPSVVH